MGVSDCAGFRAKTNPNRVCHSTHFHSRPATSSHLRQPAVCLDRGTGAQSTNQQVANVSKKSAQHRGAAYTMNKYEGASSITSHGTETGIKPMHDRCPRKRSRRWLCAGLQLFRGRVVGMGIPGRQGRACKIRARVLRRAAQTAQELSQTREGIPGSPASRGWALAVPTIPVVGAKAVKTGQRALRCNSEDRASTVAAVEGCPVEVTVAG
jgi:hypothetical protein